MDDYSTNSTFESFEVQLSNSAKDFLKETAKWAYLLSIVGFVFLGLILILALFMFSVGSALGSAMGGMNGMGALGAMGGAFVGIVYILMALLYFFPILYLFKFASKTKKAIAENNTELLTNGIENLKSHYKFIGILMAIVLSFYALAIIMVGIAAAVS
jgi:hypothetical protein